MREIEYRSALLGSFKHLGKLEVLIINEESDPGGDVDNIEVYELADGSEEDDDDINDPILEEEPKSSVVSVEEPLKEVDLGTEDEPRKVRISASLTT